MRYHFFFNDTATTEIYTLSLHDALPISCDGFIRIGTDLPALRNETMTAEEVEVVAEELAKIGGIAWYPGREEGTLIRAVTDRYRDRARLAIAALARLRATKLAALAQAKKASEWPPANDFRASS